MQDSEKILKKRVIKSMEENASDTSWGRKLSQQYQTIFILRTVL